MKRIRSLRKAIRKSDADTVISFMWDINLKVILACLGLKKKVRVPGVSKVLRLILNKKGK